MAQVKTAPFSVLPSSHGNKPEISETSGSGRLISAHLPGDDDADVPIQYLLVGDWVI